MTRLLAVVSVCVWTALSPAAETPASGAEPQILWQFETGG